MHLPGQVERSSTRRSTRSNQQQHLHLAIPQPRTAHDPNLRPSPSARNRAISESSVLPYSPLEIADSTPLWHGSYDRMPSLADSTNSNRPHVTSQQQQLLSQSLNHFRLPLHAAPPPQQVRSVPTTPLTLSAAPHFNFPPNPPLSGSHQNSLDGEGLYETYEGRGDARAPPAQYEPLRTAPRFPHHAHSHNPQSYHRQTSAGAVLQSDHFNLSMSSASTLQQLQQDLNQSMRTATYSPDHYSDIHYPEHSSHPTDIVV